MTHSHQPANFRYAHGFRWCGFCGEWRKVNSLEVFQRCSDCHYKLRHDALLKAARYPEEVHRY